MRSLIFMSAILSMFLGLPSFGQGSSNASMSSATSAANSGVSITPVAGAAIFSVIGNNTKAFNNSTGFVGGGLIDLGAADFPVKFETGLLFIQEGSNIASLTITNDYLTVPVLAKFVFGQGPQAVFNVHAGFGPSFLISSDVNLGPQAPSGKSLFNDFDIPVMVGAGMAIALPSDLALTLDVTYMRSMTSVAKDDNFKVYNQGVTFLGGLMF